jgi:hypothetical protein
MKINIRGKWQVYNKLFEVMNNAGLILVATLFTYYYVVLSTEMFHKSMGLSEKYIEYPFYNLVKTVEPLFTVVLPFLFFVALFLIGSVRRYNINRRVVKDKSIKKMELSDVKDKTRLYGVATMALWVAYVASLGEYFKLEQFDVLILLSAIVITTCYLYLVWNFKSENHPYSTVYERIFLDAALLYVSLVVYGYFLVLALQFYSATQPYTLTISEQSIECKDNFCDFEYLVSDKNGYAVWSKLSYKIPMTDDVEKDRIYLFNNDKRLMPRKITGETMFEVEVHREFGRGISEDNKLSTVLYFEDWKELKDKMEYDLLPERYENHGTE